MVSWAAGEMNLLLSTAQTSGLVEALVHVVGIVFLMQTGIFHSERGFRIK